MSTTQLMNVNDFAKSLGVSTACIRRWILERRLSVVKIGRLVKIPETEIARIITAGARPAHSAAHSRRRNSNA